MTNISFAINPPITAPAISDLREAVGWERQDADYPAALQGYWATIGGIDTHRNLLAWCAILSDGVRHAVLLDVIVHPLEQGKGVGSALVAKAIAHIFTYWPSPLSAPGRWLH